MANRYLNASGVYLYETGTSAKYFFGTSAAETLTGTAGNDTLLSNGGPDVLKGGDGDDMYVIYTAKDKVVEIANNGVDTILSYDKYTLPDNVENLTIEGNSAWYGAGNALANILTSRSANQQLDGGAGDDVLIGSTNTLFIVQQGNGSDTIYNWNSTDRVRLTNYGLTTFSQVQSIARQVGVDTQLNFANGEKLVIANTKASTLTAANFDLSLDMSKFKLLFADEFDALSLWSKGGTWRTEFGYGGSGTISSRTLDNSSQIYMDADWAGTGKKALGVNPFSIDSGVLTITAAPTAADVKPYVGNYAYTSGLLTSRFTYAQEYGYIEARVKMPAGQGFWPQFWMIPTDNTWPPEIDIFEVLGKDPNTVYMTQHYLDGSNAHLIKQDKAYVDTTQWHTYGVDWAPDYLTFYIDGIAVAKQKTPAGMDKEMYLLMDLSVGGVWSGAPDATTGTGKMEVDYIRAWRTDSTVSATVNGVQTLYNTTPTTTTEPAVIKVTAPANAAPVASADTYAAVEDTKLTVDATKGVLANDSDANGDAITAVLQSGPAHGTLQLNADGSFTYTGAADYNGVDSFVYVAKDAQGATSAATTVTLNVAAVNDGPVANADSGFTTAYGAPLTISASKLLANDTDVDGDVLSIASVQGASRGTVALVNGDVVFTPTSGTSGAASFTYTASDGHGGTSTATVSLTVAAAPVEPTPASTYIWGANSAEVYDKSASKFAWQIAANGGDDILKGSNQSDSLNGGDGNDIIFGNGGADIITGGKGIDMMTGGADSDTFVFKAGDLVTKSAAGVDTILDFEGAGVVGGDFIRFVGFSSSAKLTVVGNAAPGQDSYTYHITDGANSGDVQIYTGGKLLSTQDYGFFAY